MSVSRRQRPGETLVQVKNCTCVFYPRSTTGGSLAIYPPQVCACGIYVRERISGMCTLARFAVRPRKESCLSRASTTTFAASRISRRVST
eukprot:1799712-Pleurochrysis_carterae.AAC.1